MVLHRTYVQKKTGLSTMIAVTLSVCVLCLTTNRSSGSSTFPMRHVKQNLRGNVIKWLPEIIFLYSLWYYKQKNDQMNNIIHWSEEKMFTFTVEVPKKWPWSSFIQQQLCFLLHKLIIHQPKLSRGSRSKNKKISARYSEISISAIIKAIHLYSANI
jgi:hypothetical protein